MADEELKQDIARYVDSVWEDVLGHMDELIQIESVEDMDHAEPGKPTLDIDFQVFPYEDMHNKLTIALQSGEGAPDLVDIEINMFANYLKGDIGLAPMNEYVEPIEDHLVMSRLNNYAKDGKFYGIELTNGTHINKFDFVKCSSFDDYFSILAREQIESMAKTTNGTYKVNQTMVKSIQLKIPPLALQQEFAAFVARVDQLKADTQLAIDKLQMLYDSLAQEYFSE